MRNRYLDFLRALAIARVVVYHTTGFGLLSIIFPAMAVMFALAGSLMAGSLDKHGVRAVGRRLRRLLPPLWILALIFVPLMLVSGLRFDWRVLLWALPVQDPPANGWGSLALSAIWYLRDYLWFVLVSPLALPVFRRFPLPSVLAPMALLVAIDVFGLPAGKVLADFALYFGCWLIGFAHHDGMLRRMSRRTLFLLAGSSAVLGAAWFLTHRQPATGFDLNYIRLGHGLWSAAFVLILLGLAPAAMPWVDRWAAFGRTVTVLNSRAVTIYLWHIPVVVGCAAVFGAVGLWRQDVAGLAFRLAVVSAGVALAVVLLGWVEDVAARRRPVLLPGAARKARVPATTPSEQPVESTRPADSVRAVAMAGRPAAGGG